MVNDKIYDKIYMTVQRDATSLQVTNTQSRVFSP